MRVNLFEWFHKLRERRPPDHRLATSRDDPAALLRRSRRLKFLVPPRALAELSGAYHGARAGLGLTFSELRPYEAGDDVRHIDWNATARRDRPIVRRFVEERALTVRLVVDVSSSMRFGPTGRSKADRATQAAALLATAASRNGDRTGLILIGRQVELNLEPNVGSRQLARILRALAATPFASRENSPRALFGWISWLWEGRTPTNSPLEKGGEPERRNLLPFFPGGIQGGSVPGIKINRYVQSKSALSDAADCIRGRARRALIVILSDFLSDSADPPAAWSRLARSNRVVAFRLVDPRENELPDAGLVDFQDGETGGRLVVDTTSKAVRDAYRAAANARSDRFRAWCLAAKVEPIDFPTDLDPLTPLLRFFSTKRGKPR